MITSSKGKSGFEQKIITSSKEKIGCEKNDHFKPKQEQFQSKKISPPASPIVAITTPEKQHGLSRFAVKPFPLKWLEHVGCPLDHPVLRVE